VGDTFVDNPIFTAVMLDRIPHPLHIVETKCDSYRLKKPMKAGFLEGLGKAMDQNSVA
jgi:hypothetical protein